MRSFAVVRAITKAFANTTYPVGVLNWIKSHRDRLPLGAMTRKMDALLERPLSFLWREIISPGLSGNTFTGPRLGAAMAKNDCALALRAIAGCSCDPDQSARFRPTPDRLWTLLSWRLHVVSLKALVLGM